MKCERVKAECAHCGAEYLKRKDRVRSPDFCCLSHRKQYNKKQREWRKRECLNCGAEFMPRVYQIKTGDGKYCSIPCSVRHAAIPAAHTPEANRKRVESLKNSGFVHPSGREHHQFKETYIVKGYRHCTDERGRKILESRYLMQKHLGRELTNSEVVHHEDEDRLNNNIENLTVMTRSEHAREHARRRREKNG